MRKADDKGQIDVVSENGDDMSFNTDSMDTCQAYLEKLKKVDSRLPVRLDYTVDNKGNQTLILVDTAEITN